MGEATAAEGRVTRLVFDVGNTRIKAAGFRSGQNAAPRHFAGPVDSRDWIPALDEFPQAPIAISSVNPTGLQRVLDELNRRGRSCDWIVRSGQDLFDAGVAAHRLETPETVGVDRVLGCLGAKSLKSGSVIVVDAGTATTTNAMDADSRFLGGTIAPGRMLLARSLHAGTAMLPEAIPDALKVEIGASTNAAIRAGVSAALVGGVERAVAALKVSLPDAEVFLTGGDAPLLSAAVAFPHRLEPHLVSLGLERAFETWLNRSSAPRG